MSDGQTAPAVANRFGRTPPWRDLRWITVGVLLAFLTFALWGLFGPEPPIVVSRATTFVMEPLAADGLPDYVDAALAAYGPPPPAGENAAVPLVMVHRDLIESPEMVPIILDWLGSSPPASGQDGGPSLRPEDATVISGEAGQAIRFAIAWEAEDFPADELTDMSDSLVEASLAKPQVKAALDRSTAALDRQAAWERLFRDWTGARPQGWRAIVAAIECAVSREARSVCLADEFLKHNAFERPRNVDENLARAREAFTQARAAAEPPPAAESGAP